MVCLTTAEEKWEVVKGEIKRTWTRLSAADVNRTQGDSIKLRDIISQKYGAPLDRDTESKLDQIMAELRRELKEEERIEKANRERSIWRYRQF